ncbi:MAG TPA: hypothetical protein VM238_12750, partial [Phycisphaerae bacterium]|nr:hypothetical protein [Phycisphaerae bacterium]
FQSLYGEELKRVAATRDVGDDLALAAKLLGAARAAESQPALLAVLCEKSFDLAAEDPKGCETALGAAELLARKTPERAQALQERVLSVRQHQYTASRGDARSAAGEALIKCLADVAAARTAVGAFEEAARFYRQALTVARAIRSASAEWIGTQMKRLGEQQRLAANLPRLVANLKANPDNREARDQLVRLLLVDLDNPPEAAKYLDDACDPLLCKYVPAAAKPVEAAPEAACMEMADWYRQLAAPAVPGSKVAMFVRAREYYERFLDLHGAADMDRTKVELALKKVDEDLKALGWTQPPGPWIDVLKTITAENLRTWGDFKRTKAGIVSGPKDLCRVSLPICPHGNYELEVRLTCVTGANMGIAIPVGDTMPILQLGEKYSGIQLIRGKMADENETKTSAAAIKKGRPVTMGVKVLLDGDKATISVTLDGKSYINWTGPQSALSTEKWGEMPRKGAVGLKSYMCNMVCSSIRVRTLSGKAITLN